MTGGQNQTDQLRTGQQLVLVVVVAAVVAAAVTAVIVATGLSGAVPPAELRMVGATVAPWVVVGVVLFVLVAFTGGVAVFFAAEIRTKVDGTREQWSTLPDVAKAVLVGLPLSVVAALAVVATDALATSLSAPVRLAVPLIAWLGVTAAAYTRLQSTDRIADLHRRLWTGVAVGVGLAAATILLEEFVGSVDVSGWAPLVVLLVTAPLAASLRDRSARREDDGYLAALLVRTGFAQVRRVQTMTVAVGVGLLVGVVGAVLVNAAVGGFLPTLLAFLLGWGLSTVGALRWFRRTDVAHSDLVITDVRERSAGGGREIAVTNRRDGRVDLRNAKIRDTEHDLYRTNFDVLLAPGQTEVFDIPPEFSLFPSTDDLATDLPMGFAVSKSADAPVVVTRTGRKFELRWGENATETAGRTRSGTQETHSPDVDGREDNA